MVTIPSNAAPLLIGFPVFALFGWRAFSNYRRLHNPLSGYFAASGFSAAVAFFFWSAPLAVSHDMRFMQITAILGDIAYYTMLVIQASLVHYLTLRNRVSKAVLLTPVILLALAGLAAHIYGYLHNGVYIVDNILEYDLPLFASIAQTILLVNVLLVGILLLSKLKEQATARNKSTLIGVACLYLLSGIAGLVNVLSSGASNDSPIIIGSYIFGFAVFVTVVILARFRKPSVPVTK